LNVVSVFEDGTAYRDGDLSSQNERLRGFFPEKAAGPQIFISHSLFVSI
jgi:hypothetical protein